MTRTCATTAAVLLLAAGAARAEAAAPSPDGAAEVKVVRDRLIQTLVPPMGPAPIGERQGRDLLEALTDDGRWPDIDYASKERSGWYPARHVRNALALAQAYRAPGHPLAGNPEVRDKANLALRWWVANDLQCPNWWWNDIGVPMALGDAMLLMADDFPGDLLPGAIRILKRAERRDMTGQNTLWVCGVRLKRGCIEGSPDVVGPAFRRIADEIKVTTGEGIQPDFSFHQHGALLYSGGYGRGFAVDAPHVARLGAGTRWALADEKIGILTRYLLDGEQWMIRGDQFDPSATGREITRRGHSAASLARACRDMIAVGAPRREEFDAFARRLARETDAPPLLGNRHFPRSDFMVHHRPGWYASVRLFSKRVYNSELVNGEGLKSHHLADGLMLLMRSGREFDAMPPVWDWKRLPGTTCEQGPYPDPVKQRGATAFVGGATDGVYGVCAMDLKRGALSAKKAWFFFDDGVVALGTGVTCTSENRVLTAIAQRPLEGDVELAAGQQTSSVTQLDQVLEEGAWVRHDGVRYALLERTQAGLRTGPQTGSYRDISAPSSAAKITRDVFSLWIDHGAKPAGATYAYMVAPLFEPDGAAAPGQGPPARVIVNTAAVQAVQHALNKAAGVVFWEAGSVRLGTDEGVLVRVDRPCLLLVHEHDDRLRLAVANPANEALTVNVTCAGALEGEGCTWSAETKRSIIRFDLPGGAEAGRSVVRELTAREPD